MKELASHLLDILQNSLRAKATRITIDIQDEVQPNVWQCTITDNGCGMTEAELQQATSPFYTTKKGENGGLGLPLFQQCCEQTGGSLKLCSEKGKGTTVTVVLHTHHKACPPVGNLPLVVVIAAGEKADVELCYQHKQEQYKFSSAKERQAGLPLQRADVIALLRDEMQWGLNKIGVKL